MECKSTVEDTKYSIEEVEERLYDTLYEALKDSTAQEDGLIDFEYDEETGKCHATLNVCIIEEDDFIGFTGY